MCQRQTLANLLRNCSKTLSLDKGVQVHGIVLRTGYESDLMLNNDLIAMYGKCSKTEKANKVFDGMLERNVVSWTTLMCAHLQDGNAIKCLSLFSRMDTEPNEFTLSTSLKAAGVSGLAENAAQIHATSAKTGFDCVIVVGNAIVSTYAKLGRIAEAAKMFAAMPFKNDITWNTMIAGYACQQGNGNRALALFREMQRSGEAVDEFSFGSALKACSGLGAYRQGSQIHGLLIAGGVWRRVQAGALVDMYVKCGRLLEARRVFEEMENKSVISGSALVLGYAQEGDLGEAMGLFRKLMTSFRSQIDGFVLSSLIGVFADFALIEQGKQVHALAVKLPSGLDISVLNSVLDMYHKCGCLSESERVFSEISHRNVISWTSMITGYAKHGLGGKAVELFDRMGSDGLEPDGVAYLAVLTACSHAGLIDKGQEILQKLCNDRRVEPRIEHYSCMVDLLGRAGRVKEARNLVDKMPSKPNAAIWQTLLGACRVHGDMDLGREVGEKLLRVDCDNPVNYVMLSNLYADGGHWKDLERVRSLARSRGLRKEAGRSWVEIEKEVHFFCNRDESHPRIGEIRHLLGELERRLKEEIGYVPGLAFALQDVEDESKEESLRVHSEKLAIGLALLHGGLEVQEKRTVRVFKNLRVCGDCHSFIKGLSQILDVVLVVRDANRFHRFEAGLCSCGDYW